MRLRIIGSFLVMLLTIKGTAQINIQWESRLDGLGSFIDKAVDLELDATGNTYVTGSSYSGTSYDLVTVKYDSDGVELWRSSYGGAGIDEAHALVLDSNDDVIITGSRFIGATDWDIVTLKYDGLTGALLWSVIHAGSSNFDFGKDVTVDASDNVIVVGSLNVGPANIDFITIKYSPIGTLIWSDSFGGSGSDDAKIVITDAAGNIYVGGHHEYSVGTTFFDFGLVKYNSAGVVQWSVTEDSGFGKLDTPYAMALDGADNIILAGSGFTDILNEEDYLTMKFLNATGVLEWKKLYAGDAEALDVVNALVVDGANNIYVTGKSKSIATSEDYYTIAYSALGVVLWEDRYSTDGLGYDEATDIRVSDSDLSVYITGYSFFVASNNDFTTLKYNAADGVREWITIFDGPSSNSDQALKMKLDLTENIFITGNSHGGGTNLDYSTIKYCQLTTVGPPDTSVCDGGSVDLVASGGDDVTWEVFSGDASSMSCTVCETMTATPAVSTIYLVSSTSLSGCIDYDTVEVVVNAIPSLTIYNDTPLDFCVGGSVSLYTDTYDSYSWSTGSIDSFTVVTTAGVVSLTVIDSNVCSNTADVTITVYDLPTIDVGDDISICPEGTAELEATGATSYVWDTDLTLSALLIADPDANPIADTEYKVTGTDDNGCTNRDSLFVFLYTLPSVNAGADETVCIGDSVHLLATGATSYIWDYESTLSSTVIADPFAFPSVLTEYFVVGTDDNGCTNIDSINVSTLAVPIIDAGLDTAVCIGNSVQLFASGGLLSGYIWDADVTLSSTTIYNPFASPTTSRDYIVTGRDINDCVNTDTIFVAVYDLPLIDAGLDDNICIGDSVHLNATGGVIYTWDSHPSLSDLSIADPWAKPIATQSYTVTGEDVSGCINSDEVTVNIHELPAIDAGDDISICFGDSTRLNATGGDLYIWDIDPTLSNFVIGDPWAKPSVTTTYYVEGTDGFSCSNTDEVTVTVNPLPTAPVLVKDGIYIISSIEEGNQWYHDSGELTGEVNDSLYYPLIGLNGEYWVVYTESEFGCSIESNRIDNPIIITDIGIQENELNFEVKMYPNPTNDILNIAFEEEVDQIAILTLDGKVIQLKQNISAGIIEFSLKDLPSGTYLVQILKGNQSLVKKLIKM